MNYYERVQKSIDFIEENLISDLSLKLVASKAYMSIANFYRLFYAFTGHSIKDYIRRRRLTNAFQEIITTSKKVIDISIEYKFESPEGFSRAFKREFGKNPSDFRKAGILGTTFERIDLMCDHFLLTSEELDQYPDIKIIKELPPMKVVYFVGRGYNAEYDSLTVLFKWIKDNQLDQKGFRIFGFDNGKFGEEHEYETWFAFNENENISQYQNSEIKVKRFSGGHYAVMSTLLEQIESSWDRFQNWLKNSRYDYGSHQCLEEHLPVNDEQINGKTRIDLYMPIYKKTVANEKAEIKPASSTRPQIIQKDSITIIGLKCDTTTEDNNTNFTIVKLWDRFNKKEHRKIRDIEDHSGGYGVFLPFPKHDGEYSYIAGFSTKATAVIPEGMASQILPSTMYAVFTYISTAHKKFDTSGMPAFYGYIFYEWLSSSPFKYNKDGLVFEYYQRPRMMKEYPEIDIYVPIIGS